MPPRSFLRKIDPVSPSLTSKPAHPVQKPEPGGASNDESARYSAEYIAQIASELAHIAAAFAQLEMVAYFLKMAQMEAADACLRLKDKTDPG